jgi:hypothetical protein
MTISQMMRAAHMGVRELKNNLPGVLHSNKPVVATEHGKPTYFLLPYADMVEIVEMLEEARNSELVSMVAEGRKAYGKGGWRPASKLWKKLDL